MPDTSSIPGRTSAANTSAGLLPGDGAFIPPLASSLASLLRLKGSAISARNIVSHLPGGFAPPSVEETLRAAERAGAQPRLLSVASPLDIPAPALPCILMLGKDSRGQHQSCVILDVDRAAAQERVHAPEATGPDGAASTAGAAGIAGAASTPAAMARIIYPESAPEAVSVPLADLLAGYGGYAVFLPAQEARRDPRADDLPFTKSRHWFWGTLREFVPLYRDVAIASFVVNLLTLASPLFIMNVYDRVVPNNAVYTLWVLLAGLLLAHLMDLLLRNLRSYFVDTAGRNADVIVTSRLMQAILHMRMDNKPASTGGIVNNMREFDQVRDFFGSTSLLGLFDIPFLLLFVVLVAFIGGPMVFLVLVALPLMVLFVWMVQKPFQRSVERQFQQNMHKNSLLVEITAGLETVKSILAQGHMQHKWEAAADASAQDAAHTRRLASLANTGTLFIIYVINALVIVIGVYRIQDGLMTQGGLIACVILVSRALGPLMQLATMITNMQRARTALAALERIVTLPVEDVADASDSKGLEPELAMRHVTFRYPQSPTTALRDISLRIRPGEKVGIVGPTGSGKSTLARLLVGLYQPADGNVTFGGVDIRQLDQADLRSRVGFMPQDNYLFYGSVRENIALGCPWVDMKTLVHAAEIAGVADFVNRHPAGYDMQVGERGSALSGGQRQAVALARTLVRAPEVFILDEPSSNLDMQGEHELMLRLKDVSRNKTLIILTHRPSLLGLVDRVLFLHDGALAADGPRDEVLRAIGAGGRNIRGFGGRSHG
ncbi:type I secretion system permease/ATPase [Desulfovibrio sp. OttesenSCG-928-G15]|nr:type I secretion system permease/ATPase [Desulfovibrio sp. OttesenSCG-928-G15]